MGHRTVAIKPCGTIPFSSFWSNHNMIAYIQSILITILAQPWIQQLKCLPRSPLSIRDWNLYICHLSSSSLYTIKQIIGDVSIGMELNKFEMKDKICFLGPQIGSTPKKTLTVISHIISISMNIGSIFCVSKTTTESPQCYILLQRAI